MPLPNRNFASRLGSNQAITSSPGRSCARSSFLKEYGISDGAFGVGEWGEMARLFTNGLVGNPRVNK